MIVYGDGLRGWLEEKLGCEMPAGTTFIGFMVGEEIYSVCGFHSWDADDVQINISASRATLGYLRAIFRYVFEQLKCARATCHIRDDNEASQKLAKRLGFQLEGIKRKAREGHDVLVYGLLKEEYHHGKFTEAPHPGRSDQSHSSAVGCEPRQP
jgi:RimJ/RimL family protein N-acetyltransferase